MIHKVTFLLLVIGGLNWLVLALAGWDVSELFGGMSMVVSKVIYVLVEFRWWNLGVRNLLLLRVEDQKSF